MKMTIGRIRRWLGDQRGATATEYGVLMGFIAILIVTGVGLFGLAVDGYFNQLAAGVKAALGLP